VLRRDDPFAQVVVPAHRAIDTGTLASILEAAGLSSEQFIELLKARDASDARPTNTHMRCARAPVGLEIHGQVRSRCQ